MNINKHLFAAYCGMIKSGYELMDLSDEIVVNVFNWINSTNFEKEIYDYFLFAKTNTVQVNPYYPRGSDLSAACFFQNMSINKYVDFLHVCESTERNNPKFIEWISELPHILKQIEEYPTFENIFHYYRSCLEKRFTDVSMQVAKIMDSLKSFSIESEITVIFAPNLLQAKFLADYVLVDDKLYIISGTFRSSAIIHEYLHIALKPIRSILIDTILKVGIVRYVDVNCMIELGYLRENTVEDKAHALEECIVRALVGVIDTALNLSEYYKDNLQNGFISVPRMVDNYYSGLRLGMPLYEIVQQMLKT